MPFNNLT